MVAAQAEISSLPDEGDALIRPRAIADDISEAPDLIGCLKVDVSQHCLQCVKIGVDVREDGDAHDEAGTLAVGAVVLVRLRLAARADERSRRSR